MLLILVRTFRLLRDVIGLYQSKDIGFWEQILTYDVSDVAEAVHDVSTGRDNYVTLSMQNPNSVLNVSQSYH